MNWWMLGFLVFLIVDQIADHHKKINSIQINDYMLANDPEFVRELAEAVKKAYRRDIQRKQQNKSDYYPDWPDAEEYRRDVEER